MPDPKGFTLNAWSKGFYIECTFYFIAQDSPWSEHGLLSHFHLSLRQLSPSIYSAFLQIVSHFPLPSACGMGSLQLLVKSIFRWHLSTAAHQAWELPALGWVPGSQALCSQGKWGWFGAVLITCCPKENYYSTCIHLVTLWRVNVFWLSYTTHFKRQLSNLNFPISKSQLSKSQFATFKISVFNFQDSIYNF